MYPQLNTFHLKLFCDAVTYDSVSEAAKMNYVTQSAVSQAIAKLEVTVGAPLSIHNRQKFQVTEEGRILFEQACLIFKTINETFEKIQDTKDEISGSLKFVTTKSLGMSFIGPTYKRAKHNLPNLEVKFKSGGMNMIRNSLKREEAEFAIVLYDKEFFDFAKIPLQKGRFNLYRHVNCTKNEILVDYYEGTYVNELKKWAPYPFQAELSGWEILARFTDLELGIGFLPDYILAGNRYPEIKIFPCEMPPFEYEICAIHNKDTRLSRNAQAFIEQFTLE
jgi:DNA-binding transcriptional LysR family regulator